MRDPTQPLTPGMSSSSSNGTTTTTTPAPLADLRGKTALITGGATGIGLALALALAAHGMKIVIASTNAARLDAAAATIRASTTPPTSVLPVICDVSSAASVAALQTTITSTTTFSDIDLLCCNAGITTSGPYLAHRAADYDWVYGVVLHGTINCIRTFYPSMCARGSGGHILLTGSQAGLVPDWFTEHGPYTSAKAAVMALGAALRPEAAEHGVGVSVLVVAGTKTEIMKGERSRPERFGGALVPKEEQAGGERKKREARRIEPDEVAEMAVRGVKENRAWIATHPELKAVTEDYFGRILEAYDR